MNRDLKIKLPVIPIGEPTEKTFPVKDKNTGDERNVSVPVLRCIVIPENDQVPTDKVQTIELSLRNNKSDSVKKNAMDVVKACIKITRSLGVNNIREC